MSMTAGERAAWNIGFDHGQEAVKYNLSTSTDEEDLGSAAFEAEQNARQFAGHIDPTWDDGEWEEYEDGFSVGVSKTIAAIREVMGGRI